MPRTSFFRNHPHINGRLGVTVWLATVLVMMIGGAIGASWNSLTRKFDWSDGLDTMMSIVKDSFNDFWSFGGAIVIIGIVAVGLLVRWFLLIATGHYGHDKKKNRFRALLALSAAVVVGIIARDWFDSSSLANIGTLVLFLAVPTVLALIAAVKLTPRKSVLHP